MQQSRHSERGGVSAPNGLPPAPLSVEHMADGARPGKAAAERRAKGKRANHHEKQLRSLLSKSITSRPAAVLSGGPSDNESFRRGRRGATLTLYESENVAEAVAEPESPKYLWQARLLAKRFPKCTGEQIAEALEVFDGDTDKASIICERQSRNAAGPVLGAMDKPLSMPELEALGAKQLAHLAKQLRFKVVGNAHEMRQRLAALLGLTPDVMVRLEWILDAALAAKLPSVDREGAATIRSHIAAGRFTAAHYIRMYTERLRISEADETEEQSEDSDEEDSTVADQGTVEDSDAPGTPPLVAQEGALRHEVYARLRKARCAKHLRIRARLSRAAKLRGTGTLAGSTLGSADFRALIDSDDEALGSTWKRASQVIDFAIGSDDGCEGGDEVANLTAWRTRDWPEREHDVDSWLSGPNNLTADVVALAAHAHLEQHTSSHGKLSALVLPRGRRSPPVDVPSSPVRSRRHEHSRPRNHKDHTMLERRFENICQALGSSDTSDTDLEAWRTELQRRRLDASRIGMQLIRQLPDLDLKPVWLDGIERGHVAVYDRLATAGRARSPCSPL